MSVTFNSPNVVIGHMSGGTININNSDAQQTKKERPQHVCEDVMPVQEEHRTSSIPPDFFCISQKFTEKNIRERLDAELKQSTFKVEYCRALYRLQHMGCINISQYESDTKRANIFNQYQHKFQLSAYDFCKARANK